MLIPKKMSLKKLGYYFLIMGMTLGTTFYLVYKNFLYVYFTDPSVATEPVEQIEDSIPAEETAAAGTGQAKTAPAGLPINIFSDEKFKNMRGTGNYQPVIETGSVGKKNPFAPLTDKEQAKTIKNTPIAPAPVAGDGAPEFTQSSTPEDGQSQAINIINGLESE